jgi:TPR repeat protein
MTGGSVCLINENSSECLMSCAQYNRALLTLEGDIRPRDERAAETLLRQAARQNLVPAMLRPAQMYETDEATVPNTQELGEAAKWFGNGTE